PRAERRTGEEVRWAAGCRRGFRGGSGRGSPASPLRVWALSLVGWGAGGGGAGGVQGRVRTVLHGLPARDVDLFLVRLRRWWGDLVEGLGGPYGERHDLDGLVERVAVLLAERYRERDEELKLLDLERSIRPDWFQDPAMVGYVCYTDRF